MIKDFNINSIIKPSQVAGLDIYIQPDGQYTFNAIVLKQSKNAIVLIKQQQSIKSIDELKNCIGLKIPLSIIINGKGILHKKIEISENDTTISLLGKFLPNAKADDFYLFSHSIDESYAFASVIRKNAIDPIIEQLQTAGFDVINISLGPFITANLLPLISRDADTPLVTEYCTLQTQEGSITDYTVTEKNAELQVKVGSDTISNYMLPAFAASFGEFIGLTGTEIPLVNTLKDTYRNKRIFKTAGTTLLVFFLSVLLINFLVYSHYNANAQKLNSQVNVSRELLQNLDKLKKDLNEKSTFMNKMGLLQAGRTSFFADRIAAMIPASIQLKEMNINPLVKNPNDDKDIAFNVNSIVVKGDCKKNTELNEWIKQLKRFDWVNDVTLTNFTQDKEKNMGIFNMELKVK